MVSLHLCNEGDKEETYIADTDSEDAPLLLYSNQYYESNIFASLFATLNTGICIFREYMYLLESLHKWPLTHCFLSLPLLRPITVLLPEARPLAAVIYYL